MENIRDRPWLEKKYVEEGLGATEIARMSGCPRYSVYDALERYGIPTRKDRVRHPKLDDKAWLEDQYYVKYRNYTQIAEELGTTKHVVYRAFKRLGLKGRSHTARYAELNNKAWLIEKYVDEQESVKDIAKMVGCSPGAVSSSLIHCGVTLRSREEGKNIKYPNGRIGELGGNWQGGRRKAGTGYIMLYKPDHPFSNRKGCVMEHRLIMEEHLGRYLRSLEVIHHIDGDKLNNEIDNLMLLPDRAIHAQLHFEANKEIAYLKKMTTEGRTDFPPYVYECLPKDFKDIHNPFDL